MTAPGEDIRKKRSTLLLIVGLGIPLGLALLLVWTHNASSKVDPSATTGGNMIEGVTSSRADSSGGSTAGAGARAGLGVRGVARSGAGVAVGRGDGGEGGSDGGAMGAGERPSPQEVARVAGEAARRRGEASGVPRGGIDSAALREAAEKIKPQLRQCYGKLLDDFPEADGTIKVLFKLKEIDGIGEVSSVVLPEGSTLVADEQMGECVKRAIKEMTVPMERGASELTVSYPFRFSDD